MDFKDYTNAKKCPTGKCLYLHESDWQNVDGQMDVTAAL